MACREKDTGGLSAVELIAERGLEGLSEALTALINTAMCLERERHLNVSAYERSEQRRGYANGYKPKTVKTRVGELRLAVPQVREGGFYPQSLEKGLRSERALKLALAEMYVAGVSTRKVARITEELCGFEVSSTQVSRCAALLDEELAAWRSRPLGAYAYVVLDARYESVRQGGQVLDAAVLLALGVRVDGKREILGVSAKLSEAEVHWRDFLIDLKDRGLHGVKLFVSDDHAGLKAARKAVFPSVPWQRCQFHLQQNAGAYVPRQDMRKAVAAAIRDIFNAPDADEAKRLLEHFVVKYQSKAPKLSAWAAEAIPQGLAVFALPTTHQRRLRTTNVLERVNKEIKRRTRVATLFPNEASCERLVTAIAMEISEEWVTGRIYLNMETEAE
ncbi:MAG: IS256 family transposase [Gammaproteobacteria bacterium]|nr:MAG: IS256 family transposase [Gammaproteobacteria bacterium]